MLDEGWPSWLGNGFYSQIDKVLVEEVEGKQISERPLEIFNQKYMTNQEVHPSVL